MESSRMFAAVRTGWWVALIGLIVGGGAALAVSLVQTPQYTSSTQLFVTTADSTQNTAAARGSQLTVQRAAAYARLIPGGALTKRVIDKLGLELSPRQLKREIVATAVPNTSLINVTVTDPSARQARRIADAIGTELPALVNQLETPPATPAPPGTPAAP